MEASGDREIGTAQVDAIIERNDAWKWQPSEIITLLMRNGIVFRKKVTLYELSDADAGRILASYGLTQADIDGVLNAFKSTGTRLMAEDT